MLFVYAFENMHLHIVCPTLYTNALIDIWKQLLAAAVLKAFLKLSQ